jgi:apolipoprotein N-acyltransferase
LPFRPPLARLSFLHPRLLRLSPRLSAFSGSVALGAIHAWSFAPAPSGLLQIAATALLFLMVDRSTRAARAALAAFGFGLGWFGFGFSWMYISLHRYGELPAWIAIIAIGGLAAALALIPAGAAAAAWRLGRPGLPRCLIALPACWAFGEYVRGTILTGLPWLAGGYAQVDSALAGLAPLLGVYGVTLAAAFVAGAAAGAWQRRAELRVAGIVIAGAVVLAAAGALARQIAWTAPEGAPIRVRLVQGNIAQDLKFGEDGMARAVQTYQRLMRGDGSHVDLIALPESVFPVPLNELPPQLLQSLYDTAQQNHSAIVFGAFIEMPPGHFLNSALGIAAEPAPMQSYSKHHLVPFGEFIPYGFRWFVDMMQIPIGDQDRGPAYQAPMRLAGQRIAINICYEDLFGAELIRAWHDPAAQPTLLLNLSNLAWFDDSLALPQHLQISRMRAIETGRPMLRATNTGATAIIGADGAVRAALPFRIESVLEGAVHGYRGTTPYVRIGNAGFLAIDAAMFALAIGSLVRARRREPSRSSAGHVAR